MASKADAASSKRDARESIKVVVRCRPISSREQEQGHFNVVTVDRKLSAVRVARPSEQGGGPDEELKSYTFDFVYPPNSPQQQVFEETAKPIVDSVLNGYNGTIFAYGQTGTGKTFTMEGVPSDPSLRGVMPNAFNYVFDSVNAAPESVEFLVRASFLEIYMDEIYDLLNRAEGRKKLDLRMDKERGVFVKDLTMDTVKSPDDLFSLLHEGQKQRRVGATAMNPGSSRSHSIFTIVIESSTADEKSGVRTYKQGKLNLVDLAGSERLKKTGAEGERMEEAKYINLSLSTLGNVIKALASPTPQHVPFRDSKLTRLLEDSLGGNTKTCMIANIGPANHNYTETMSTLRYADRAKSIKNKPKVNEDPKDAQLRQMQEEIAELKAKLLAKQRGIDLSTLSHEQIVQLGLTGQVPEGAESTITKVRIVETGITVEDLQRAVDAAEREVKDMEHKTEKEKQDAMKKKKDAESRLRKLEEELARKDAEAKKEADEEERAAKLLQEKQHELLRGGGQVEEAVRQRKELDRTEQELQRRRMEQNKLEKEIRAKEEAKLKAAEEAAAMSKDKASLAQAINTLYKEWKSKQEMHREALEELDEEEADILESIRDLNKQINLRSLMIESFMPCSFYMDVRRARRWDDRQESWVLPGLEYGGNNVNRAEQMQEEELRQDDLQLHELYLNAGAPPHHSNAFLRYDDDLFDEGDG